MITTMPRNARRPSNKSNLGLLRALSRSAGRAAPRRAVQRWLRQVLAQRSPGGRRGAASGGASSNRLKGSLRVVLVIGLLATLNYYVLYARRGTAVEVQHLVRGMAALDGRSGDAVLPRFLGQPDNRDFFYLLRREEAK